MAHLSVIVSEEHYEYLKKKAEEKDMPIEALAGIIVETVCDLGLEEIITIE